MSDRRRDDRAEDEADAAEWKAEQERLAAKLAEKKEKERVEREAAGGGPSSARSGGTPAGGAPAGAPPTEAGGGDKPTPKPAKKKKLLNGTNIEYRYPSGSVYVGGFKDGKLHGYGKYHYHPSNDLYEGEWVTDMKHGQGTYTYDCGDRYVGEWRVGKKYGKGTYAFASGDEYIGSWKEDRIHGYGVFTIARNNNRYEGNWEESYRHGFGVLKCGNGDVYEGNWARGKEDGQGVLTYANGNRYAGDWRTGQMDGKGVMQEGAQLFTVEHIAGYLIAKVQIPDDGTVDPDWNKAMKLYKDFVARKERQSGGATEGSPAGGSGGGDAATAAEATKMKVERDMWEAKYKEAMKSAGAPADLDDEDEKDAALTDIAALKERLGAVKSQRNTEKRRGDDAEARTKQLKSEIEELRFQNKRIDDLTAENEKLKASGGGGGADQAELDKMQRRVVELERELQQRKDAVSQVSGARTDDPTEMKVKLELLEGEVRNLRMVREDLQKVREQHMDAQKSIMTLENRNEELLKEINVSRQRAAFSNNEENESRRARERELQTELDDAKKELQDAKTAAGTHEQAATKAKAKLKEAEGYARRCNELEVQVSKLRQDRGSGMDQRSDELEAMRLKNAEVMREVEELRMELATRGNTSAAPAASSGASSKQLEELQTKLDAAHADYKKEKKKHKKASGERDELVTRVTTLGRDLARAQRQMSAALDGKVTVIAKLRPQTAQETDAGERPVVSVVPDKATVLLRDQPFAFDATFPETARVDEMLEELRDTLRAPALGFNACLLSFGPLRSGKTHLTQQLTPQAVGELFKGCEEVTRANPQLALSVTSTCVELNCDGIFDLNDGGSTGRDLRAMKNAFGAVVMEGAQETPLATARDAAVDFTAALGRRRKQRSHVLYTLHVQLQHKVKQAVLHGKLTFADLAGAGALGEQDDIESAKYVNTGIMALARVADALATPGQEAVPYREDPLTECLADVLGGNCRLAVVAALAPACEDTAENAGHALATAATLAKVQTMPQRQYDSSDVMRLRGLVAQLQSPEEAAPKHTEIVSLRE